MMCHLQHVIYTCTHTETSFHPCAEMEDKQDCSLGTMELERTENKLCSGCEDGITPAPMEVSSPEGDNPQHNEAKKSEGDLEPKPVKAQEKEKGEDKKKWVEQLEAASKHEKVEPRLR